METYMELLASAQSSPVPRKFANTSKRILKNRNWTFPVVGGVKYVKNRPNFLKNIEKLNFFIFCHFYHADLSEKRLTLKSALKLHNNVIKFLGTLAQILGMQNREVVTFNQIKYENTYATLLKFCPMK